MGKGELLGSFNRLRRAPVTFLGPGMYIQGSHCSTVCSSRSVEPPSVSTGGTDSHLTKYRTASKKTEPPSCALIWTQAAQWEYKRAKT